MEQRRQWREKSGGVLKEGKELEDAEEVNEVEDEAEEVGEVGANCEGSHEIAVGVGVGADARFLAGAS
jgi:hypothetical protein